jgi:hypothetical protein
MQKKDVYNYLAQTYLSEAKDNRIAKLINSKKKKNKIKRLYLILGGLVFISIIASLFVPRIFNKPNAQIFSYNINLPEDAIRLNYNFSPDGNNADRMGYTVNLNSLNADNFKFLTLSAKKQRTSKAITLRIDMENLRNEFATSYIANINNKRQNFKLDLSNFKKIKDFSSINKIIFTVERWNANAEKDSLIIDNLSFTK